MHCRFNLIRFFFKEGKEKTTSRQQGPNEICAPFFIRSITDNDSFMINVNAPEITFKKTGFNWI